MKISVAINYCSRDSEFIQDIINQCLVFSDDIHIGWHDHFFDGREEDIASIIKTISEVAHPNVHFHTFKWNDKHPSRYWHNHARASLATRVKCKWTLFLDSDEVPDGERFKNWLASNGSLMRQNASLTFLVYWYFRSKKYRAKTWEETVLLANTSFFDQSAYYNNNERLGIKFSPFSSRDNCLGMDSKPLFHHYSWARGNGDKECEQILLQKVKGWGHEHDRNWDHLIREEFSHEFTGRDFVHNYEFDILD